MSKKQDKSVVCKLVQTLVKPTTFLRLPKLLLELLIRINAIWCQKCPKSPQFASASHHNHQKSVEHRVILEAKNVLPNINRTQAA